MNKKCPHCGKPVTQKAAHTFYKYQRYHQKCMDEMSSEVEAEAVKYD